MYKTLSVVDKSQAPPVSVTPGFAAREVTKAHRLGN